MKRRIQNFGILGVLAAVLGAAGIIGGAGNANATLEYATSYTQNFTINDSVSVTVPSTGLIITGLVPGTTMDSSTITVNVQSNNSQGYTLNATVGNNTTIYNTRELRHTDYAAATPVTNSFASIDLEAGYSSLDDFTEPNTWGYSYSLNGGSTWQDYNGLPKWDDEDNVATLNETSSATAAAGDDVEFKIAAKAGNAQAMGEYNNVINFTAVANASAVMYMQDVASWGSTVTTGQTVEAIDNRDNKTYYVTRLADGNLWMTQNLDLDLSTGITLTSANTDISGSWTPSASTYVAGDTTWNWSTTEPESYNPGDLCWNGVLDPNWETTLDTGTVSCASGNRHFHVGNYYNWTAAVAMNDSSSYKTDQTDVNQSICPAGWRLPTYSGSKSYDTLVSAAGLTSGTDGNIQRDPTLFVYGGVWGGGSWTVGSYGYYWSSVVNGSDNAYYLDFYVDGYLFPQNYDARYDGGSVRCVAR